MKKALNYIVLGIFAIGALAIWLITGQAVMLASTLFILILMAIIGISEIKMGKETLPEEKPTIDSLIAQYGEPDDIIVTDPTRSSEVDGAILVYTDTLVFNQTEISKTDIVDMTFNNSANPYVASDYQIILTTKNPNMPILRIHVGSDSTWAQEVLENIRKAVFLVKS